MSHDNYSLSARVYNHIRDGILAGTFAKGDELKEKNIGDPSKYSSLFDTICVNMYKP